MSLIYPCLNLDFAASRGAFDPRLSFTRATTASYLGQNGLIKTAVAGQPRIDFDYLGNCLGFLIEEARTNLLTYSEQFDNAAWTKVGTTVSANAATAPDGTTTDDLVKEDSTTGSHSIYQGVSKAASSITYTASVFLKAGPGSQRWPVLFLMESTNGVKTGPIDLTTGSFTGAASAFGSGFTLISSSITNFGGGIYRVSITATSSTAPSIVLNLPLCNTSGGNSTYTGDNTSGIYAWGAQIEAGAFATSYIPTTSAGVTRNADVCSMRTADIPGFVSNQGAALSVADSSVTGAQAFIYSLSQSGVYNDSVSVFVSASNVIQQGIYVGAADQGYIYSGSVSAGALYRIAGSFKVGSQAMSLNGAPTVTSSPAALPTMNTLAIGSMGSVYLNGHIRQLALFPQALASADLVTLTQ